MQKKGHVVPRHIQIAFIDVGHVRQRVKVFDLRTIGIVHHASVLTVGNAEDLFERLALRELYDRVVELLATNEVDGLAFVQRFVWSGGHRRSNEGDLQFGIRRFHGECQLLISLPARSAGEQHQKFVLFADVDGFIRGDVMRRRVQQTRALQHPRRISEPNRVPVRFNFSSSRPARTSAAVKVLERGRVQEQGF